MITRIRIGAVAVALAAVIAAACGDNNSSGGDAVSDAGGDASPGVVRPYVDLDSPLADAATFWDLPFPSDLRLTADGTPDLAGFPNPHDGALIDKLLGLAGARRGFPQMPVAYFRFDAALPARHPDDVIAAAPTSPILLIDIDPGSPERGRLWPTVVKTFVDEPFTPGFLIGVAPRPGIVLAAATTYAVVVTRGVAVGADLVAADAIAALARGDVPAGQRGAAAAALYAPLWPLLDELGVGRDDVVTATVFTTGDEVALLAARSDAVRVGHDAVIGGLVVDPVDGAGHDGFCELIGTVTVPQLQRGVPPFDEAGDFALDEAGTPIAQGELTVPLTITLPAGEMPVGGWPLYQFFHGSGGLSSGLVDLGKTLVVGGEPTIGEGPGWVVARHGIAAASSALPLNPERQLGATDYEYLNINNLAAFPYTFQQGVIEQRLLLDALLELRIEPAVVAACAGVTLPAGETAHRFAGDAVVGGGQSMGAMYTNMIGAVEPRLGALVPTGAGGFWNLMILDSALVPAARQILAVVFDTTTREITFMHPGPHLLGLAWEIADPMVSMSRLARRPLPGFPARHVYQPVGADDIYFPEAVFDAAALAYGNQQAGDVLWAGTQAALGLDDLAGVAAFPVSGNRTAGDGPPSTGVVVQFAGDGIDDAHYLYRQLDEVKHQYGCFLRSYLDDGVPTVPAPAGLDTPCR